MHESRTTQTFQIPQIEKWNKGRITKLVKLSYQKNSIMSTIYMDTMFRLLTQTWMVLMVATILISLNANIYYPTSNYDGLKPAYVCITTLFCVCCLCLPNENFIYTLYVALSLTNTLFATKSAYWFSHWGSITNPFDFVKQIKLLFFPHRYTSFGSQNKRIQWK